ncbi:ABC transporter permease [Granulicoccus sp. GXG6511]|uniref:ABC transporter permease n=1 Tax=Granulicoccus sp. GXG6511 TaxID=3381351 RepID=UPI003D7C62AE
MSTLAGLGSALHLTLRRNWLFWLLWAVGLSLMMPATLSQYDTVIPPGTDPRIVIEPLRINPTMLALLGPAFDLYDKGGFVFWRSGGFTSMVAGLIGAFGIIRATRAEEDEGRVELIRSGPVGRHAPLAAAVLVALAGCVLMGAATAGLLVAGGLRPAGSVAAGLALTANGFFFVALGAVLAQVFDNARAARAWTAGIGVGGMFLLRALVDGAGPGSALEPARWAIPLEWPLLARPFAGERWWVFGLSFGVALLLVGLAFALESRRDHGAGLRHESLGRAYAGPGLSGAFGLAARLQRGAAIGWTAGLLVSAVAFGSIVLQIDSAFTDNANIAELVRRMGGTGEIKIAFLVAILGILTTVVAFMAVSMLGRLRSEEVRGHAEAMLATAVSRWRFAGSHLVWALGLPMLVLVLVGAGLPIARSMAGDGWDQVWDLARGAAGLIPGLVAVVGFAMLLIGWLPRAYPLVWVVIGWSIFTSWFAALLNFPEWVVKFQPWGHLSVIPRDAMDWTPFAIELAIGVALLVVGLVGYRRRSIVGR